MGQIVKIALQADVGGFVRNFSQADSTAGKFGATLEGTVHIAGAVGSAIDAAADKAIAGAKKMAAFGTATTLAFVGMGVAAAQFEANMNNVRTLMGEDFGGSQFRRMNEDVLALSTKFPTSANDIAKGLYNIASSGFQGADAMTVLRASVVAASAGLTTVDAAGTAITSVLNAYGMSAQNAAHVSDVLFQTVNLGVVTFDQLTGVIGDVVGTAAAAGISIEQVGAAIATMTLSGISADEAGTSLNRLLQSMIDPSEALAGAFKALGYESGQQAVQQDGLRAVMDKLRVASNGNLNTLLAWFPEIRAARGALALMSAEGENYARVAGGIEDRQAAAGATMRAFNIQADGASQAWDRLVNSLKAAGIAIGTYFLPPAKLVISIVTDIVNSFNDLPGPIKAIVGYVGALSSVLLALAGVFLAFRLRTLVANIALETLGRGFQAVGERTEVSSAKMVAFGTRLQNIQGPFGVTRAALGGVLGMFGNFGESLGQAGARVEAFGSGMSRGGSIVGGFGRVLGGLGNTSTLLSGALSRVGGALSGMLRFIGPATLLSIGLFSAFENGKNAAQDFSDKLTEGLNGNKPASAIKTLQSIHNEIDKVNDRMNADTGSVGGFFSQLGKNIGDLGTNLVGIDVIKDSSWDDWLKSKELTKAEEKVLTTTRNFQKNMTDVWNKLHPDDQRSSLALDSKEMEDFSLITRKAGIDMTKSFSDSGPARQRAADEIQKAYGFMSLLGGTSGVVSEAMVNSFNKIEEASRNAAKGASDAFQKSFDLLGSIDPKATFPDSEELIPIGVQIADFYTTSLEKARTFYDGLQDLQARGLDPTIVAKFLAAGPQAAGDVVKAAAEDSTNGLIQVLNSGEAELGKFQARAAEMARLTQRAVMAPTDELAKQLPQAMNIANQIMQQGSLATPETVAAALSMDPASVRQIAGAFGITLSEEVIPKIKDLSVGTDQANQLKAFFDNLTTWTHAPRQAAASLTEDLQKALNINDITQRNAALRELMNQVAAMDSLTAQEKTFVFKLIGDEAAKTRMKEFLDTWNQGATPLDQEQKNFLINVIGQPDAVQKIKEFGFWAGLTPQEVNSLLQALGTPEAIAAMQQVIGKADEVDKSDPTVDVNARDNASGVLDDVGARIRALDGVSASVFLNTIVAGGGDPGALYGLPISSANGNILRFANGGENHIAQYAKGGSWRLWAEPETGGESYIPWAMSKRGRSTKILAATASAFGYQLTPMAAGGIYSSRAGGSAGYFTNTYQVNINAPVYGVSDLQGAIVGALNEHDRSLANNLRRKRE